MLTTLKFIREHPLTRQNKMSAVKRWVNWQIGSRLVPGPVAVDFVNGAKLLVQPGMTGATGNVYAGLHEFHDMAFVLHLLRQDDLFVDVGANVGTYTILAASVGARSISLEPIGKAFAQLMQNVRLNDFIERVDARQIGAGSKTETATFTDGLDTVNHLISANEEQTTSVCEVNIDTLDNIVADLNPTLIKVDVEGGESDMLAGASHVLQKASLLGMIVELNGSGNRYGKTDREVFQQVLDYGFQPFQYDPYARVLKRDREPHTSGNTLFLRRIDEVKDRVSTAPTFSVLGNTF